MATKQMENINDESINFSINKYFSSFASNKWINENSSGLDENKFYNSFTVESNILIYLLGDILNYECLDNSIDDKTSFFKFLFSEKKFPIIVKLIYIKYQELINNNKYNETFLKELTLNLNIHYDVFSDINIDFISSCNYLEYFNFEVFNTLYSKLNPTSNVASFLKDKKHFKNLYYYVRFFFFIFFSFLKVIF